MPQRPSVTTRAFVALCLFVVALWMVTIQPSTNVAAQETEAAAEPAAEPTETKDASSGEATTEAPEEKSALMWLIETSGWIGAVLLALSLYFVATTVTMFIELRPQVTMPPETVETFEDSLKKKDYLGLYKAAKADESFFGRLIAAGLAELPQGLSESREAMDRTGEAMVVDLERRISILAVLGTLGPMIGLLGTLKGMIASFSVIAMSDTQLKASEVAGGISEALVLTFEGVALSVPAIYFYSFFRNRIQGLSTSTSLTADEFIRRVAASPKQKSAAPAAGETAS